MSSGWIIPGFYSPARIGRPIHEGDRERRIDPPSDVLVRALDFAPTHRIYLDHVAEGVRRRLEIR